MYTAKTAGGRSLVRLELSVWLKGRAFELREDHAIFGLWSFWYCALRD